MKARVKSLDNACAELIGFQFIMMPGGVGLDPQTQRLVRGEPQPVAMLLVAFKDQFAIGPVFDMLPEFDDTTPIGNLEDAVTVTPGEPTEADLQALEELVKQASDENQAAAEAGLPVEDKPKIIINTAESAGV